MRTARKKPAAPRKRTVRKRSTGVQKRTVRTVRRKRTGREKSWPRCAATWCFPPVTAIYEAASACRAAGVPLIGDGGSAQASRGGPEQTGWRQVHDRGNFCEDASKKLPRS
jgi:hypothetical protein